MQAIPALEERKCLCVCGGGGVITLFFFFGGGGNISEESEQLPLHLSGSLLIFFLTVSKREGKAMQMEFWVIKKL